ncbi:winged helix-turn-helix domain-containing protein [Streptomyces sp. NPDC000987]|uniref:helix-turn-helix transcriptional regulator n=1 Tax=Streptomyces sp. NPDC000987 TaxID=3154374 RepID=UPI0033243941
MPHWTFLTNHAHVLLCVVRDPEARLRDIADTVGITERAAQRIMTDLVEAGYLERNRQGRRNIYHLHPDLPLRHPMDRETAIGQLVSVLTGIDPDPPPGPGATETMP